MSMVKDAVRLYFEDAHFYVFLIFILNNLTPHNK